MLHDEVKKAVDSGDTISLKYIFCDCLDGDPTFNKYVEDYEYCKKSGQLFVPHVELHKMSCDSVTDAYWVQLKNDFMENPSIKRMEHMREVAKILYSDRIKRISSTSASSSAATSNSNVTKKSDMQSSPNSERLPNNAAHASANNGSVTTHMQSGTIKSTVNQAQKKASPVKSTDEEIRKASEPIAGSKTYSKSSGESPKKAPGVGYLIATVIVIVLLVIVMVKLLK